MIVDRMIEIVAPPKKYSYYESLGYIIPRECDSWGNYSVKIGTKIIVNQRDLSKSSDYKIDVICDNCKKEESILAKYYYRAIRRFSTEEYFCGKCSHKKTYEMMILSNSEKSFGAYLRTIEKEHLWSSDNKISSFSISSKNSTIKIYMQCENVAYHVYLTTAAKFNGGRRCPFCQNRQVHPNDSLANNELAFSLFSNKNKESIYSISPASEKSFWWKCENGIHNDYIRSGYSSSNSSYRCPNCVRERNESFLQEKVRIYLESLFDIVLHENDCTINPINPKTGMRLRYDNEVPEINLIIEVMGIQHESPNSNFFSSVKEFQNSKWRDEFKKQYALNMGFSYLDIWYYEDDKNETWKKKIDQCLYDIGYFN